ncbi:hypothetical protein Dimus_002122 [Dionaea muscipula]
MSLAMEGKIKYAIELMNNADKCGNPRALDLIEVINKELLLKPTSDTYLLRKAVEEGFRHFSEMKSVYGIEPRMEHYLGILDVLWIISSGHLVEAIEYIEKWQMQPTGEAWEALCKNSRE